MQFQQREIVVIEQTSSSIYVKRADIQLHGTSYPPTVYGANPKIHSDTHYGL